MSVDQGFFMGVCVALGLVLVLRLCVLQGDDQPPKISDIVMAALLVISLVSLGLSFTS